jgi:hypothetical protein
MNKQLDHIVMEPARSPSTDLSYMPEAFKRVFGPQAPFQTDLEGHERDDLPPIPYQGQRPINPRSRGACRFFAVLPDLQTGRPRIYGADSQIEYHLQVLSLVDPSVAHIQEQFGPVPFVNAHGLPAKHFIDLMITKKDGRRVAVAVKPTKRLESGRFLQELTQLRKTMPLGLVDEMRLVTERSFSRDDASNAELYLRFSLTPDRVVDERLAELVSSLSGSCSINDICEALRSGGRGFRSVVRALYEGKLVKLSPGRIDLFTEVRAQ